MLDSGELLSCGANAAGQLGHGGSAGRQGSFVHTPKAVHWPRGAGARPCRVACGADFSIATDTAGRVYSWGHPQYGQLGNGSAGESLERAGKLDYAFRCVYARGSLLTMRVHSPRMCAGHDLLCG